MGMGSVIILENLKDMRFQIINRGGSDVSGGNADERMML